MRVSGSPNFQRPLTAKLCVKPQMFPRCKNVLEVLYHRAKFGGTRISSAAGAAKNVELLVCLSVRLVNVRDCAHDFAMKALENRNDFHAVGQRKLVVVHPCSTSSDFRQLATPQNAEGQKWQNLGFSLPEGDRIHRSRRKLACKRTPQAVTRQIWPSLIKEGRYRSPLNVKICLKLCFFWPPEADTVNTFK